jgi:tyrosinase
LRATNKDSILTNIQTDAIRNIFIIPTYEEVPPFAEKSPFSVDSENSLDIDYAPSPKEIIKKIKVKTKVTSLASEQFTVNTEMVNIRVKGFNGSKIPSSFDINLLKDGRKIATRGFFQPNEVEKCANCVENAIVHFDFKLTLSEIANVKLSITVEPLQTIGHLFPLDKLGSPTINIRLLLSNQ